MRIDMRKIGGAPVLAGSANGKKALAKLLAATVQEPAEAGPIFLDFSKVEVVTASFLRESVFAFRNLVRGRRSNFYPVVANVTSEIRDELVELVSGQKSNVVVTCRLAESGKVSDIQLIGELEPIQRKTLDHVRQLGETDASELMRTHGAEDRTSRTTAWNNRLTALSLLGLLIEVSQGRAKKYRPLFEGI
jgi:hypothetical protein